MVSDAETPDSAFTLIEIELSANIRYYIYEKLPKIEQKGSTITLTLEEEHVQVAEKKEDPLVGKL